MGPTPPTNYRVVMTDSIKTLYFNNSSNDVTETEVQVKLDGKFVSIGKTSTDNMPVPPHINGVIETKGSAKGLSGWGLFNNPPVEVDYL